MHLACSVETNRSLLIAALLEAGLPDYLVNPKIIDRQRKPAGAKIDAIDAYRRGERYGRLAPPDAGQPLITKHKVLRHDKANGIQRQTPNSRPA